mmetsp:Transcript_28527/g.60197  ORF Transcript_28527/g.60197 Transcript_28527/m.60197 type:complete len:324 (-) Transcript_28527:7-978(-)
MPTRPMARLTHITWTSCSRSPLLNTANCSIASVRWTERQHQLSSFSRHTYVMILGFPRNLCTYFQQRGRCGRVIGQLARCLLIADLSSYITLYKQIYNFGAPDDGTLSAEETLQAQLAGVNCAITPLRHCSKPNETPLETKKKAYALIPFKRRENQRRCSKELLEVLQYTCLDLGCMHIRGERYLSAGALDSQRVEGECGGMCPICSKKWSNLFLRIDRTEAVKFLRIVDRKHFPMLVEKDTVLDLLWKTENARIEKIFRKKTVQKKNVNCLFLQFVATGIIVIKNEGSSFKWHIGETIDPDDSAETIQNFNIDKHWVDVNTF